MHNERLPIAYLTSLYARASDSFIRGEVIQLRRMGFPVHTFSIRKPELGELVSPDIQQERESTDYLLSHGMPRLMVSLFAALIFHPRRFIGAAREAMRCSTPGWKGRLWVIPYLAEAAYLAARLRALQIRHLHNHIGEGSATVVMLASLLTGVPYSLTVHGPNEFDKATILALDVKTQHAAFIATVSHFGRSQMLRWIRSVDWPKIRVVRCGVDASFLEASPQPVSDTHQLVCVGRLAEQKGHRLLLEAAEQLAVAGVDFRISIIGDGPLRSELEAFTRDRGLDNRIRFLGWASATDVRATLLQSRAMVLPSFAEGLPVVFMEALALRRPVITTWIAGVPELICPGENGWLVPAGDVDGLAAAMREALSAPAERLDRMGEAGAQRVAQLHDARKTTSELVWHMFGYDSTPLQADSASRDPLPCSETSLAVK